MDYNRSMKEIQLTQGKIAIVDDEDFERVSARRWFAVKYANYGGEKFLALTNIKKADGKWTNISLHRFIMNPPIGVEVDHINKDTLDNQKANLRLASRSQNARNRSMFSNNKSGFKGVYFCKRIQRFIAQIICNKKRYKLGHFHTAIDAAKAYNDAAIKFHGEFASLNKL